MHRLLCFTVTLLAFVACTADEPSRKPTNGDDPVPPNGAPTLASVALDAGPYTVESTITLNLGKASDPEGDKVTFKYQWYVNGTAEPGAIGESFAGAFAKGDEVYVVVTPADGVNDGQPVESQTVTIANTPPVVATASLGVGPYRKADTITAFATGADVDGDAVTFTFRWFVNGSHVSSGPSLTGAFAKGDLVTAEAVPSDGAEAGDGLTTSPVTIQNTALVMTGIGLGAGPFYRNATLTAMPEATDADGDVVTYGFRWFLNGNVVAGATGASLTRPFALGDTVAVEATPSDGVAIGDAMRSAAELIVNAVPSKPGVTIQPAVIRQTMWAAVVTASTNADGDAITYSFAWYHDGVLQNYAASQTLVTAADLADGDWEVRVVASDGMADSPTGSAGKRVSRGGQLGVGTNYACAMTVVGGVKCWGENSSGRLGDGSGLSQTTAVSVSGLSSGVESLVVGSGHTCVVTTGGAVKCWGSNAYGQLGNGTTDDQPVPVQVSGLAGGFIAVAVGAEHTCALTNSGGVKCWGYNMLEQLGNADALDQETTPVDVMGLAGVKALAAGGGHTCVLTTAGGVKCWGANWSGQLGDGTGGGRPTPDDVIGLTSGIRAISAGYAHTCALTTGGGVKCWGENGNGQVGNGTTVTQYAPVDVTGLASGVVAIAAAQTSTCALLAGGGVKCWGHNSQGQLGNGNITDQRSPADVLGAATSFQAIALGDSHGCALDRNDTVRCWGENSSGQLANGNKGFQTLAVAVTGAAGGAQSISGGEYHTCTVNTGGAVECWGVNWYGQLGNGDTNMQLNPVAVSGLTGGVQVVAAGERHTCALTSSAAVKCWGNGELGQLGNNGTVDTSSPVGVSGLSSGVQAIAVGALHSCALTNGGAVKCWGFNQMGQLGNNSTVSESVPVAVNGLSTGVLAIAAGLYHTCAVVTGGAVKCWGYNGGGQLGNGNTAQQNSPVDVSGLTSGVSSLAAGAQHTCAILSGAMKCWGNNLYGQIGDGSTTQRLTPVDIGLGGIQFARLGSYHTCALTSLGGMKCWGFNGYGQLGIGLTTDQSSPTDVTGFTTGVVSMGTGNMHTCASLSSGAVKCWGNNYYGQLGNPELSGFFPYLPVLGL